LFYQPLPAGAFSPREARAIERLAGVCASLDQWTGEDTLAERLADLLQAVGEFGPLIRGTLENVLQTLPGALKLSELKELLVNTSDEVEARIIAEAYQRMGLEPPPVEITSKVRIMTMHGAKGLSARVVFIPGLEEEVFPGPRRRPYPGLIEEAARLLYVSITRGRAACFLSYARRRLVYGRYMSHAPSRFNRVTGGTFVAETDGASATLAVRIVGDCANL
jgi:superfamily I DNA/RNA helicase